LLLWITSSMSPQEIHNWMMDSHSEFQKKMIEYLESVHQGEFLDKDILDVQSDVKYAESDPKYKDPTQTLPMAPPGPCEHSLDPECQICQSSKAWWSQFREIVNDLLLKSNVH
ncbi:hypothetical protein NEOLEDRAFT_1018986, partial [Neolentinus lepideus HHB14362 ss-1]